jgi:hypothetical protein
MGMPSPSHHYNKKLGVIQKESALDTIYPRLNLNYEEAAKPL